MRSISTASIIYCIMCNNMSMTPVCLCTLDKYPFTFRLHHHTVATAYRSDGTQHTKLWTLNTIKDGINNWKMFFFVTLPQQVFLSIFDFPFITVFMSVWRARSKDIKCIKDIRCAMCKVNIGCFAPIFQFSNFPIFNKTH